MPCWYGHWQPGETSHCTCNRIKTLMIKQVYSAQCISPLGIGDIHMGFAAMTHDLYVIHLSLEMARCLYVSNQLKLQISVDSNRSLDNFCMSKHLQTS